MRFQSIKPKSIKLRIYNFTLKWILPFEVSLMFRFNVWIHFKFTKRFSNVRYMKIVAIQIKETWKRWYVQMNEPQSPLLLQLILQILEFRVSSWIIIMIMKRLQFTFTLSFEYVFSFSVYRLGFHFIKLKMKSYLIHWNYKTLEFFYRTHAVLKLV